MKDPRWFEEGPGSEDPADRILRHIRRYYVVGAARTPADLPPISQEVGRFYGACSHPSELRSDWLFRSNGFTADAVPEEFSLVGMTDVGHTEHVVLMWRHGGRCFWFRDEQARVLQPRERIVLTVKGPGGPPVIMDWNGQTVAAGESVLKQV